MKIIDRVDKLILENQVVILKALLHNTENSLVKARIREQLIKTESELLRIV